jgi:sulfite exporter TauE/SafE
LNSSLTLPLVVTAFMTGLLGSGHCFGMCGGIAGGFGALAGPAGGSTRYLPAFIFNLGRLISYGLLGGIAAVLIGGSGEMLDIPGWSRILRLLTAIMILLIGLRFMFGVRWLDPLEKLGARLWRKVQPLAIRLSSRPDSGGRLLLGLCWGLIPCGLVYSILLTAASTASLATGSLVMLAFGLGTLPSMLAVAWISPALGSLTGDKWVRRIMGFSLILLGAWTISMVWGTRMH